MTDEAQRRRRFFDGYRRGRDVQPPRDQRCDRARRHALIGHTMKRTAARALLERKPIQPRGIDSVHRGPTILAVADVDGTALLQRARPSRARVPCSTPASPRQSRSTSSRRTRASTSTTCAARFETSAARARAFAGRSRGQRRLVRPEPTAPAFQAHLRHHTRRLRPSHALSGRPCEKTVTH
jgi:hypothetical protein